MRVHGLNARMATMVAGSESTRPQDRIGCVLCFFFTVIFCTNTEKNRQVVEGHERLSRAKSMTLETGIFRGETNTLIWIGEYMYERTWDVCFDQY